MSAPDRSSDASPVFGPLRLVVTGRIADRPEVRRTPSGVNVARFRLATRATDAVLHHNVLVWGTVADTADRLVAGRRVRLDATLGARCPTTIADHGFDEIELVADRWEAA